MRSFHRLTVPTLLLIPAIGFMACDRQASQYAAAERELDAAIEQFERANAGYLPVGAGDNLDAYREGQLNEAVGHLNTVTTSGSAEQKLTASRMLADIYASQSQEVVDRAGRQAVEVAGEAATSLRLLQSIGRAQAELQLLQRNEVETQRQLQDAISELKQKQAALQQQAEELRGTKQTASQASQAAKDQADELYRESVEIKRKVLLAQGMEAYDLEEMAANAEAQAVQASMRSAMQEVDVERADRGLAPLNTRLDLLQNAITELEGQISQAGDREVELQDKRSDVQSRIGELTQSLNARVAEVHQRYEQEVATLLDEAAAKAQTAVGTLQSVTVPTGAAATGYPQDLLAAHLNQASVLSQSGLAIAVYLNVLDTLSEALQQYDLGKGSGSGGGGVGVQSQLDSVRSRLQGTLAQAEQAITAAKDVADQIDSAPESSAQQQVASARRLLDEAKKAAAAG